MIVVTVLVLVIAVARVVSGAQNHAILALCYGFFARMDPWMDRKSSANAAIAGLHGTRDQNGRRASLNRVIQGCPWPVQTIKVGQKMSELTT